MSRDLVYKAMMPEGCMLLRSKMRIDVYQSRWHYLLIVRLAQRFLYWFRFAVLRQTIPIPKPTPKWTITKIDYENRIVTYR